MPRCPECYSILSHRRLDTHIRWCCAATDGEYVTGELEQLARRLNDAERRIERRTDALEAKFDSQRDAVRTDDLTPQT